MSRNTLRLLVHVIRMENTRLPKQLLYIRQTSGEPEVWGRETQAIQGPRQQNPQNMPHWVRVRTTGMARTKPELAWPYLSNTVTDGSTTAARGDTGSCKLLDQNSSAPCVAGTAGPSSASSVTWGRTRDDNKQSRPSSSDPTDHHNHVRIQYVGYSKILHADKWSRFNKKKFTFSSWIKASKFASFIHKLSPNLACSLTVIRTDEERTKVVVIIYRMVDGGRF